MKFLIRKTLTITALLYAVCLFNLSSLQGQVEMSEGIFSDTTILEKPVMSIELYLGVLVLGSI